MKENMKTAVMLENYIRQLKVITGVIEIELPDECIAHNVDNKLPIKSYPILDELNKFMRNMKQDILTLHGIL